MMKKAHLNITNIAMILGVLLIVAAMALLVFNHVSQNKYKADIQQDVTDIYSLIPEAENGVPGMYSDTVMASMEINGQNYVGLIEVPAYGKTLPVHSEWNKRKVSRFPCRYTGSIYDDSLIIGTCEASGQFDICDYISMGDEVTFTDMTGLRFSYSISDIYMTKDVSTAALTDDTVKLTIFVKQTYSRDYLIIKCK